MIATEVVKAAVTKLVEHAQPGRRGHPGDHRDLQHGHVLRRADRADRRGRRRRSSTRSPRSPPARSSGAAKRVEQTMANMLTVVIGFLAKFAGLGGIPDKLVGIVKKIRAPIDKALDKIVAWIGKMVDECSWPSAGANRPSRLGLAGAPEKFPTSQRRDHTLCTSRASAGPADAGRRHVPGPPSKLVDSSGAGATSLRPSCSSRRSTTSRAIQYRGGHDPEDHGQAQRAGTDRAASDGATVQGRRSIHTAGLRGPLNDVRPGDAVILLATRCPKEVGPLPTKTTTTLLNRRRKGLGSYYVRGHLLSEKFGGPGTTWENLTPLSRSATRPTSRSSRA